MCVDCYAEALEELYAACLHLVGFDERGWFCFSDEHGDNLREHLIPVLQRLKEEFDLGR